MRKRRITSKLTGSPTRKPRRSRTCSNRASTTGWIRDFLIAGLKLFDISPWVLEGNEKKRSSRSSLRSISRWLSNRLMAHARSVDEESEETWQAASERIAIRKRFAKAFIKHDYCTVVSWAANQAADALNESKDCFRHEMFRERILPLHFEMIHTGRNDGIAGARECFSIREKAERFAGNVDALPKGRVARRLVAGSLRMRSGKHGRWGVALTQHRELERVEPFTYVVLHEQHPRPSGERTHCPAVREQEQDERVRLLLRR